MPTNPTQEIRKKISTEFCRTILWIDDDIQLRSTINTTSVYHDFFVPIAEKFQKEGFLTHLHPFTAPPTGNNAFDEDDGTLESAKLLSTKSDIIILDWHLGTTTPEHSIDIIRSLLADPASHFIVILSEYASDFSSEVNNQGLASDLNNIKDNIWSNDGGTHLAVIPKDQENPEQTADEILDSFQSLISAAYPDYLHWAALELASKIRQWIPKWLHSLPKNTDIAVLQELLDSNTEARTYLPENLLEDLVEVSRIQHLESLSTGNTKREHWPNKPEYISDSQGSSIQNFVHLLKSSKNITADNIQSIEAETPDSEPEKKWLESQKTFLQFCENLSSHDGANSPYPGVIYKKISGDDSIYLCASQPCDCARGSHLILIKGGKTSDVKSGNTLVRYNSEDYRFDAVASSISTIKVDLESHVRSPIGYNKVGQLRPAIAARIISRFWTGSTRPAVNHPTFARRKREKE